MLGCLQTRLVVQADDEEPPVAAFEITEHGSKLAVTSQWLEHLQVWMLSPCTSERFHTRSPNQWRHLPKSKSNVVLACLNIYTWLRQELLCICLLRGRKAHA